MSQNAHTLTNTDFIYKIDVICPKCNAKAMVSGGEIHEGFLTSAHLIRFSCSSCGYTIKHNEIHKKTVFVNSNGVPVQSHIYLMNSACDPFFGFPVWYCVETTLGVLWAYNLEHLEVIEKYISDTNRSRNGLPNKNTSIASRLPSWAISAKNRDYILRTIEKVKK